MCYVCKVIFSYDLGEFTVNVIQLCFIKKLKYKINLMIWGTAMWFQYKFISWKLPDNIVEYPNKIIRKLQ